VEVDDVVFEPGKQPDQRQSAVRIVNLVGLNFLVARDIDHRRRYSGSQKVLTESDEVRLHPSMRWRIWSEEKNLHGAER
jgi:hypothetical protein